MMWKASAPSNIALIKYMGKESGNQAVNPSLSMTLTDFRTDVEIEALEDNEMDRWRPLAGSAPLREESTKRFLAFFQRLKEKEGVQGSFELRSGNNFPSDAGLASSASSFAALTLTAYSCFSAMKKTEVPSLEILANISRTGSGSSCRSFFSPWCAWEGERIGPVASRLPPLVDLVAVMDSGFKKVSSSEAHKRVQNSPLFEKRVERANARQIELKKSLSDGSFQRVAEISWEEMWDMHSLFHTSQPPFFYFSPQTLAVLRWAEDRWEQKGHGPIATIDAGPNVHLLVPLEERLEFRSELEKIPGIQIMESRA